MYKVLVVDDEPNIRKGLIHIIDWAHFDCEVVGEAMDGIEGLEKIRDLKPDIVITDINMPEMGGLEMIDSAKMLVPNTKFIILTGYRDFGFIQDALRMGAFDYILKPSKIEKITEVLKKAVVELRYQKTHTGELEAMKAQFEESLPLLREKLLNDCICGRMTGHKDVESLSRLYKLSIKDYLLLLFTLDEEEQKGSSEQNYLYQFGIMNTVDEILSESYDVEKVSINENQVAIIVQKETGIDESNLYKKIENIHELLKSCFDVNVTVAISTRGMGIKSLAQKMEECEQCMTYQFYLGKDSMIVYRDLQGFYGSKDKWMEDGIEEALIRAIKTGDMAKVKSLLDKIKESVRIKGVAVEASEIKMFYSNLIYNINNIRIAIKVKGGKKEVGKNLYSFYQMVDSCSDVFELHEILEEVAISIVDKIDVYNHNSIHATLKLAMNYIDANYNTQVTLEELAKQAFVSPYYLSRMFKKELGKNFVDYLNEKRIEAAKVGLQDLSKKTYEVAESVGITDAHYFSRLFKKYTGMTPTEYRNSIV